MSGPRSLVGDDARISTTAALGALVGHALVIMAALWLNARTQTVVVAPGVVGVTLVSGAAGGTSAPTRVTSAKASTISAPIAEPANADGFGGDRLDRLMAPETSTSTSPSAAPATSTAGGASAFSGKTGPSVRNLAASGSSQVDQGLGEGEGAESIDLYAAASLPDVGFRPASPPAGDLWSRVAPCWRPASARKATLVVELDSDGRLVRLPTAIRKVSEVADPQLMMAERAALRAVEACAPYGGLGGHAWRVVFPRL